MAQIEATAEQTVDAPVEEVLRLVTDYAGVRRDILPDGYSGWAVVSGGEGAGTRFRYHFKAGPRERDYEMVVDSVGDRPPTVVERDTRSSLVTTWTLDPAPEGASVVRIATRWEGAGGVGGFFERRFAPGALSRSHASMLERLATRVRAGRAG